MIPIKINGKHLCEIFRPDVSFAGYTEGEIIAYSRKNLMLPAVVSLTSETYSRDAERTADYELEDLTLVNRKAKPEFEWSLIKYDYVKKLMDFLNYTYNFKDSAGNIDPQEAPVIQITYADFTGQRTISTYLGQTISGDLVEYNNENYWENFRIAFPER